MDKILGYCIVSTMSIIPILVVAWVIIMLKSKVDAKSRFILPAVLCGLWLLIIFMETICQDNSFSPIFNVFLWVFNFLVHYFAYRDYKKTQEELEREEILANTNKDGIMYVDFVENN